MSANDLGPCNYNDECEAPITVQARPFSGMEVWGCDDHIIQAMRDYVSWRDPESGLPYDSDNKFFEVTFIEEVN